MLAFRDIHHTDILCGRTRISCKYHVFMMNQITNGRGSERDNIKTCDQGWPGIVDEQKEIPWIIIIADEKHNPCLN